MAEIVVKCPKCGEEIEFLIKRELLESVVYPCGCESAEETDPENVYYICDKCKEEVANTEDEALEILNPQPKGDGE